MARLQRRFTQDRLLRLHFPASPFGAAVAAHGMSAVIVDLGGQAMFYTIAAIIKFYDERKAGRNGNAVRIVRNSNDSTAQVPVQLDRESTEAAR